MKRRRVPWIVLSVAAGLVAAAMAWVSHEVLDRERSQWAAEAALRRQESVRVALWRLDSALVPILAREAGRPFVLADHGAYGVETDFPDDVVRARFLVLLGHVHPVVTREPRTADDASIVAAVVGAGDAALRAHVRRFEPDVEIAQEIAQTLTLGTEADTNENFAYNGGGDRSQRIRATQFANPGRNLQNGAPISPPSIVREGDASGGVGPLVPLWTASAGGPALALVRRTDTTGVAESVPLQGFVLDWPRLRTRLLAEIADVLPGADLRPSPEGSVADTTADLVLATVPAALVPPVASGASAPGASSATRTGLAVAWAAVAAAFAAAALTLRATLADGERRARFASSVTHELRTPLTTFRLYSEMLADGMVADPAQRQVYLDTLKTESTRLATLVENVLAFARVEEGRAPTAREPVTVRALLDRLLPPLARRAAEGRMELRVDAGDAADVHVTVHVDAVGQVLANLVDNACKYAADAADRRIDVAAARAAGRVEIRVRDHGPGIAAANVAAAFAPFERANRPPGDGVPGIGLGLALSRSIARDHGGDLTVETGPRDGACLVLWLPA